jgi:tetratricopeptide (TPR) repeat protein
MKIKPLHIYGAIFAIIVLAIIFTTSESNNQLNSNTQAEVGMPNDDIHKGMNNMGEGSPSKSNVRQDFWTKLEASKSAYEKNPNDTLAMKNYAQMLSMSHQSDKAIQLYEKILTIDPKRIDILLAEGLAFYNNQNYVMAENVTKKIISIDSKNIEAKYNLGVISAAQGKNEDAKKIWKELAEKYPNNEIGKLALESLTQINQK